MPRLRDVCRHVRSKNAGPFWISVDLFFDGSEAYRRHRHAPALLPASIAPLYGVGTDDVHRFTVDALNVVKLSFPRPTPQGGVLERDLHGGQHYVRMLDLELE